MGDSWIVSLAAIGLLAAAMLITTARWRWRRRSLSDAEQQSSVQCALLRSAVESSDDGLAAFDALGRLVLSNNRFFDLLALPASKHRPASLRDILLRQAVRGDFGPGEPAAQVRDRAEAFFRDGLAPVERFTVGERTVQMQRRPISGGVMVALYCDITDRKAAEERLTQAWADAELGNRAKSEFLANMSHELRTPLNAIIGFSEVVASQMLGPIGDPKYLEYVNDIHASGMHLLAIVNDVLDMSKIEAGKLELRPGPVDVGPIVAESVRMVAERAHARGIRVKVDEALHDIIAVADERALKQITLNLLSNSVKFSRDRGEIRIRAETQSDLSLVLEVEDQGIGMTEDGIERALQPFGQITSSATRTQSGTGLGLPITKGLVEAHGGSLVIDSIPGHGTTVRVILPSPMVHGPEMLALPGVERAVA